MPVASEKRREGTASLPWPFARAGIPLLYIWLAWSWWFEIRTQVAVLAESGPAQDPAAFASLGLGARALATLTEAAIYSLWWRSRGLRLPYWRFVCWIAALSATDLVGYSLRRPAAEAPEAARVLIAVFAGPGALETSAGATGSMVGFGSLGALTALRVGMTAWAQARGVGRPLIGPLVLTVSAWLATRLVGWWSADLMKGLSPAP